MKKLFSCLIALSLIMFSFVGCTADAPEAATGPMKFPVTEEQINEVVEKANLDWSVYSYSALGDGHIYMIAQCNESINMAIDIAGDEFVKIVQLGFSHNGETDTPYYEKFNDSIKSDIAVILSELWGNEQTVKETINEFFTYFENPDGNEAEFKLYENTGDTYFFNASLNLEGESGDWVLGGLGFFDKAYYDGVFENIVISDSNDFTYKANPLELNEEKIQEILEKASCDWEFLSFSEWAIGQKMVTPKTHSGFIIRHNGVTCSINVDRDDTADSVSIEIVQFNGEDTSLTALGQDGVEDIKLITAELWGNADIVNNTFEKVFENIDKNASSTVFHIENHEQDYYYEIMINRPDTNSDWTMRRFTLMSEEYYRYETELRLKNQILN